MGPQPAQLAPASSVDALLEASWEGRGRPVRGRELRLELAVTAAFLAAVTALVLVAPASALPHPAAGLLVVAYALASRVEFPVGAATFVPTQLLLVPMFVLAPAKLVPALVLAGLLLGTLAAASRRRARLDRIVFCGGDAMYALGPALVVVAFAGGDATRMSLGLIVAAFAAQLVADLVATSLHELLAMGVRPQVHFRALLQVWGIDAALAVIGVLAAREAVAEPWLALSPLPLIGLLGALAADRTRKIEAAHDRLRALEHARARLRTAVQQIGEAFASNLDLEALLGIVERAAGEALDAVAVRTAGVGTAARISAREEAGQHVLTARIGPADAPVGMVTVSRARPFSEDECELLAHLCTQATVSATNAVRHEVLAEAEAQMRHRAFHDPLTGLANRALFASRVDEAIGRHANTTRLAAVLFLDLDRFKLVNDSLGHDAGDELLVAVARRLTGALRAADTAARFGGDEFAVLLEDLHDRHDAEAIAEQLRDVLSVPVTVSGRELVVRGSVGLAFAAPGLSGEELLRHADLAMYSAKRDGIDRHARFHPVMLREADTRMELAQDLRGAAQRGEFELRFQAIFDLSTQTTRGGEALVRWRHPRRGLLAPDEFVELAEETGTIGELGRFVLDESCRAASGWPLGSVSVNVSALQLRDPGLAGQVERSLRRYGLAADRLMLEMTESVLVHPDATTLENLNRLRELGVALAIDDFGTGYSSLSYLARFPVDVLKLDRSFLVDMEQEPAQARLVAGVIRLGHSLGVRLVAEGIERPTQLAALQELDVDHGQGFLLGTPVDAVTFAQRLVVPLAPARSPVAPRLHLVGRS